MTAPRLLIAQAACEMLVGISPAIIPVTTITAMDPSGQYIEVTDATGFVEDGILAWFDQSGEEPLAIASVSGNRITFDFSGQDYTALQQAHSVGAVVATNVLDDLPGDTSDMLLSGWPVLSVFCIRGKSSMDAQTTYQDLPILQIVYQLNAKQAAGDALAQPLWLRHQSRRVVTDLDAITSAFRVNRRMVASNGQNVMGIDSFEDALSPFLTADGVYHYEVTLRIQVRDQPRGGRSQ